jgi:hypothetical protein
MSAAFTNYSLLGSDSYAGDNHLVILPSSTSYSKGFSLTMWDSNDGIFLTLSGTKYGALITDVAMTLQQATMPDAPDSAWEDVGAAINIGIAGGTAGVPLSVYSTISVFPSADECLMPFMRLKFVAAAGAGANFSKIYRTTKGR